ncbi:MAG: hypothetical protein AAGE52_15095 [Myxococcota bacterium]
MNSFSFVLLLAFALACEGVIGGVPTERDGGTRFRDGSVVGDGGDGPPARPPTPPPDTPPPVPFEALSPAAALSKVKFLVVGLSPSAEERDRYLADPSVLPALIDEWMTDARFELRFKEMAKLLFQTEADFLNLRDYFGLGVGNRLNNFEAQGARILDSVERAWPETVWRIVSEGRDFRETMSTRTYMLNVPLMAMIAYADANPRDDFGVENPTYLRQLHPGRPVELVINGDIPIAESADPTSPNFLRFRIVPDWRESRDAFCRGRASQTYSTRDEMMTVLSGLLFGRIAPQCLVRLDHFRDEDFEFRPVTIVQTPDPADRTLFFDVDTLRSTDTLRLGTPRAGFMSDVGFMGHWVTNDSNQHRVTANQTLIVALGQDFAPEAISTVTDAAEPDTEHADPTSACWGCHRGLDPMRDFFRQSFTAFGSERVDGADNQPVPDVAALGVGLSTPVEGNGVEDLANALFEHPDLAMAWAEKICHYANGAACAPADPALQPAVNAFVESGYDFRVLFRGVLASDAVLFQARTWTWDFASSAGVAIASRSDTCLRLSASAGREVCGDRQVRNFIGGRPDWFFQRGSPAPSLPAQPSVFAALSTQRVCEDLAGRVVDVGALPRDPAALAAYLVTEVMGVVPGDPRQAALEEVLQDHFVDVRMSASESNAVRSTFALACQSPTANVRGL